jgi:Ring finger domain
VGLSTSFFMLLREMNPHQMYPEYEIIYGVGLLDDIHNFFPELIYNPTRFDSVPSVLLYTQRMIARRFNLFQYGRHRYVQENPVVLPTFGFSAATMPTMNSMFPGGVRFQTTDDISLLNPLLSLFRSGLGAAAAPPREDVVVRPTHEQIDAGSRLLQGRQLRDMFGETQDGRPHTCAICQDEMTGSDMCRYLLGCRHIFHQVCIDQWFNRNVRCPVCRADIRTYVPSGSTPRPPSTRDPPAETPAAPPQTPLNRNAHAHSSFFEHPPTSPRAPQ